MWTPTHVQVTVQRARGLLSKGKNGTNDCFVTIALGKEKYQTSCKERATDPVEWHEECELLIPNKGNKAELVLTALHRNFIGDEFLGQVTLPLADFDVYEKPRNRWYTLQSKPGKEKKNKERGELEIRIGFTVRPGVVAAGSLSDINKKDSGLRASFGQLSNLGSKVGGSLLSLGSKEKKGLKNFAKSMGSKVSTLPGRGKKKNKDDIFGAIPEQNVYTGKKQTSGDADPGVISDDEDDLRFDELSHKSSHSSLSVSQVALSTPRDGSLENLGGGEFLRRSQNTPPPNKPPRTPTTTKAAESNRWSSGPVDEWDAKLFSKQATLPRVASTEINAVNEAPLPQKTVEVEVPPKPKEPVKEQSSPKPGNTEGNGGVGALLFATTAVFNQAVKEPVPKPRQIQEPKQEINTNPFESTPTDNKFDKNLELQNNKNKEKPKEKDKGRGGAKETFSSIFGSPKSNAEEKTNSKGTPVGVTSPMRQGEKIADKLPKEIIKRFEGKSREELIEMILSLQSSLEMQKQKLRDQEEYIDNLVSRVMESTPTLLQSPFVGARPIK